MNVLLITFLAMFTEGTVEYLFGGIDALGKYLKYISMLVGIALAIYYSVDMIAMFEATAEATVIGSIISGVIIGRGGNYLNDIISFFRGAVGKED